MVRWDIAIGDFCLWDQSLDGAEMAQLLVTDINDDLMVEFRADAARRGETPVEAARRLIEESARRSLLRTRGSDQRFNAADFG